MDDKVIVDLLGQVGTLFTSSLDLKENIDFMLRATAELIPCEAATVFLLDEAAEELRAMATFPFGESLERVARFKLGEGIVGWAVQRRAVVSVADATSDPRFKSLDFAYAPRSCVVVPLESPQRLVGALTVARREVQPFSDVEQALLKVMANQSAISIDNARLYESQNKQIAEIAAQKQALEIGNARINEISRLKSEFLASMSHELRTPLNAILGFSEIMKDRLVQLTPEQQQECLENIHASGRHLLELVNDVLDLSKIEAGKMELSYERFAVLSAIREVHNVTRALSTPREISVSIDVEPEQLEVQADKSKFKQVMYNLLSNAIKFTDPQGRVWVRARRDGDDLVVDVGDTGMGIPKEHQEHIFSEFYQLDKAARVEGTGLGLSLTRRLVELHRGSISVESEPGRGSLFSFRIPISGAEAGNGQRVGRILLVEDNESNRQLTTMVLSGSGYDVDVALSGDDGLHKARSNAYDLVLMDVQLPDLDGLAVTRMLKSDPATADVPVVALSAHAMRGDEQAAMAAGCSGYITKPFDVSSFVERITGYIRSRSS